jgi:hypothetical protein
VSAHVSMPFPANAIQLEDIVLDEGCWRTVTGVALLGETVILTLDAAIVRECRPDAKLHRVLMTISDSRGHPSGSP